MKKKTISRMRNDLWAILDLNRRPYIICEYLSVVGLILALFREFSTIYGHIIGWNFGWY